MSKTLTLKELRQQEGVSQVELGERAGIDQSQISKLERNPDMRISTLRKIAEALGFKLELQFKREGKAWRVDIP